MASSFAAQSPEDVINISLARLGFKLRLGSLFEGSDHAKKSLDIYAQTRDDLLRDGDWPFAERDVVPTLLKSAPVNGYVPPLTWSNAYPPLPWAFEYAWPSDCLKVRALKPVPIFLRNFDPQANLFMVLNDTATLQRVICCDLSNPILVYTGQITDPNQMPSDFIEALAAALARRLAPLFGAQDASKIEAADEQAAEGAAIFTQG